MATPNTDNSQLSHRQWQAWVQQKVSTGKSQREILAAMEAAKWPRQQAQALIQKTASKLRRKAISIAIGCAIWLGFAILITIGTYEHAHTYGGYYYVYFGGIICGVIGIVYGLVKFFSINKG